MGALSYLRVLDLTRVLTGPWCTRTLTGLDANAIKIERPSTGDDTRRWGPPYAKDAEGNATTEAAYYLTVNRNKKSATLDISTPQDQALVAQLVAEADVLVENYKIGQLAKYGLGYESLKAIKPNLIHCSITGFGQTGPYAPRPGYNFIAQDTGGFMNVTGERDDLPGGGPQKAGMTITDLFTRVRAIIAVLAALAHRNRTGEGQHLDICLLNVQVAMVANMATSYLATDTSPQRWGNAHPNIVPYQVFKVVDGWVIVVCGNDGQLRKLVEVGDEPALADGERFAINPQHVHNRQVLVPSLEPMMLRRARAQWITALESAGVPCGPINDLADVFKDPYVLAREIRLDLPRPTAGHISVPANAPEMSGSPVECRMPPPLLGEHTDSMLERLAGLSTSELEKLRLHAVI